MSRSNLLLVLVSLLHISQTAVAAEEIVELTDDGGWCWFQDERALIVNGHLIVGSVANGRSDPRRAGDIQAVVFDLETGTSRLIELHDQLEADDHNVPAFEVMPDGRLLAIYAKHGSANSFWYRSSKPNDYKTWGRIQKFVPTEDSRITYSNVFRLAGERGRVFNFYRGYQASFKPSFAYSDDDGRTWQNGNVMIQVPSQFKHRPYVKYASNGQETVHMVFTNGHPRNFDNSLYHIAYKGGVIRDSFGRKIADLSDGISKPELGTVIFAGDEQHVAWPCDVHLTDDENPVVVYSVQQDPSRLPPAHPDSGQDIRFRYAIWDGSQWQDYALAHAGTRLYPKEDDYSGLACLDPDDISTVYISTDADPETGAPLVSNADNTRHYEIFRGVTRDQGVHWSWNAITSDSTVDNLRPMVPKWNGRKTALLWLRGEMRTFRDYDLAPVLLVHEKPSR